MGKHTYWFYLEPYTFLFNGGEDYVIYNTLNSSYIDCSKYGEAVEPVLSELYFTSKTYCVGVNENQMQNQTFIAFLKEVRRVFAGDIIKNTRGIPPYLSKPIVRIFHHPENPKTKEYNLLGENTLFHLHEVTFYLENKGGDLDMKYQDCFKQFLYPSKTGAQILSYDKYQEIIDQLSMCQIDKINIVPGSLVNNDLLLFLLAQISHLQLRAEIILPFKEYRKEEINFLCENQRNLVKIMIHIPIDYNALVNQFQLLKEFNIVWGFIISDDNGVNFLEQMDFDEYQKIEFTPWYTGCNKDFFKNNVYVDFEDLVAQPIPRQQIFRRQMLNENFFGKLIIWPSGLVYSNMNYPSIGNVKYQKMSEIVYHEICNFSEPWFYTRDCTPCSSCVNKYLCPSVSNYEVIMNDYKMCYKNA